MRDIFDKEAKHLGIMYEGALSALDDKTNPLRFSFCALALRELFREYFAVVSPDSSVTKCSWWSSDDGKVTRRDRLKYLIFGRTDPKFFPDSYVEEVDDVCKQYVEDINRLSKCLHMTSKTLKTKEAEHQEAVDNVLDTFGEALGLVDQYHEEIRERLPEIITEALDQEFLVGCAFDALDILSTHTRPSGVWDVEIVIASLGDDCIRFDGSATICVDLQWGSDGDVRRGDGAEASTSFPFSFKGTASIEDPTKITIDREDIVIDTAAHYE